VSDISFINRDGNVITFTKLEDQSVIMQGFKNCRFAFDSDLYTFEDNMLFMVDPSGGPYLTKGMSLEHINPAWYHLIIRYFRVEDGKVHIYFYPDSISKNHTNGEVIWKIHNSDGEIIEQKKSYEKAVKWIESKYDYNEFGQACAVRD